MDLMTRRRVMMQAAAAAEANGLRDGTITHKYWTGSVIDGKPCDLTSTEAYKQLFLPFKRALQINAGDTIKATIKKISGTAPYFGYGFLEENQLSDISTNTAFGSTTVTASYSFAAMGLWLYARAGNWSSAYITISLEINGETVF